MTFFLIMSRYYIPLIGPEIPCIAGWFLRGFAGLAALWFGCICLRNATGAGEKERLGSLNPGAGWPTCSAHAQRDERDDRGADNCQGVGRRTAQAKGLISPQVVGYWLRFQLARSFVCSFVCVFARLLLLFLVFSFFLGGENACFACPASRTMRKNPASGPSTLEP